jgi:hypothetical protein
MICLLLSDRISASFEELSVSAIVVLSASGDFLSNQRGQICMALTQAEILRKTSGSSISNMNVGTVKSGLSASTGSRGPTYRLKAGKTIGLNREWAFE